MGDPSPFSLRTALEEDGSRLAALHVEAWKESYPGLVPAAVLASPSVEGRTSMWRCILSGQDGPNGTTVFLGDIDGQLAGFVSCGPQRSEQPQADGYTGEIGAIYVLKVFHGRGLGRQLMGTAAARLRERGHAAAALWVLENNHRARRFYEQLGGRPVGGRKDVRDGHVLVEVAYGWSDLDVIGGAAASRGQSVSARPPPESAIR